MWGCPLRGDDDVLWRMPTEAGAVDETGEEGAACSAWDNSRCEGTVYCQARCPRAYDDDGRPYIVRSLEDDDADALLEMYDAMDGEMTTLGLPPRTRERCERWLDGLAENGLNFVADIDGQIVGHVAAAPADDRNPELVVFLHPDYRGRGIGTELLKQLVAHVDERGADSLRLTVASGNRRAIHVYDNLGFDVADRLRKELEMTLDLDGELARRVKQPPAQRSSTE